MNLAREDEYLKQQARQAAAAMRNAIAQAGLAVHPRRWTSRQRWIGLGASAAAGFVLGSVNLFHPGHIANIGGRSPAGPEPAEVKPHRLAGVIRILLDLAAIARPLLKNILAAYLASPGDESRPDAVPPAPARSGPA